MLCVNEEIAVAFRNLFELAKRAREMNFDPQPFPEPEVANSLAVRVEKLVGPAGVSKRIRELQGLPREKLAFTLAEEICQGKFGILPPQEAARQAIRTGLAVLTEGVVVAPIEGLVNVTIERNGDGSRYLALHFAGPIRAAGGTPAALTVLLGDHVRRILRLDRWKPSEEQIQKLIGEVRTYDHDYHLQYCPTDEQLSLALRNLPVELTGEPTDPKTKVRGGAVLVLCEGLLQKAPKLLKVVKALSLEGWDWLAKIDPKKKAEEKGGEEQETYLEEVIAGRPVFCLPKAKGGFRLKYGRARNTGMGAVGIHPATMYLLGLAVGTQLKLEYPGKAGTVAPVDSIDGPTVRLRNGEVRKLRTVEEAKQVEKEIERIVDLGEILISYGDFLENNFPLVPEGSIVGARMGRPEKAAPREMDPPVHILFPVGEAGGPTRNLVDAEEATVELLGRTEQIRPKELVKKAAEFLGEQVPPMVKGVKGLLSSRKVPECLEKGILRAKHGVTVFRDGTCRFDATNMPLTHFKPKEIGVSVEKLRELGYTKDVDGKPLVDEDQLVELKVQDLILPLSGGEYLLRVSQFVDDLLQKVYGLPRFYNCRNTWDLIGHLVVGIAPHTSIGVVGRIIGFTDTNVCYAHPFFHAATRRDADGDANAYMLLLDCLLNFSKEYLPTTRGGMMDAPLMLLTNVTPEQIDKVALNIEAVNSYPPELYEKAKSNALPSEVQIPTVGQGGKPGVTTDTSDITAGLKECRYRTLETMKDKINAQLELARKILAADEGMVAEMILHHHLLPDLTGNLTGYGKQQFRCTKCNGKYRRPPLSGKCPNCGNGTLILTVTRGGIEKYLPIAKKLKERASLYTRTRLEVFEEQLRQTFPVKQLSLADFLL
jgi:hypothetical protein